jgi:undecaprenyl-phosphate 4-deoxy-4-formamido-L-arabinose transferase
MSKKNTSKEISIVVPVYNSEGSLKLLYEEIKKAIGNRTWELILVNDSSIDKSWDMIRSLSEKDNKVTGINLSNNFGQHNAIMCGLKFAKGKYVITMDDDLQHPPEEISKLVHELVNNKKRVVYGQYKQKQHGWFRDLCSKGVNKIISKVTGSGYNVTSFRAIKKSVVKDIVNFDNYNIMIDVIIKDIVSSRDVGHIKVKHNKRTIGASNYSFKKLFSYAINMVYNYTLWPLRIATFLGFLISFLSILLGVFYLIWYFMYGISVQGWTSLMLLISILSGLLLFMLGIFGEYLGKMYWIINHKPQYIIKNIIRKGNNG